MTDSHLQKLIDTELAYFSPMKDRADRYSAEQREAWRAETIRQRQKRISLEVFEIAGGRVLYGPFRGMKLDRHRWWGDLDLGSQCLGLYEREILALFGRNTSGGQRASFIDIGAADGYYTTGALFSGTFPSAVAFELDPRGQEAIKKSWSLNGSPGRLQVFGQATPESLLSLPSDILRGAFVLVDVEGAEFDILSAPVLGGLSTATIVVEIHNWIDDFESRYSTFLEDAFAIFNIDVIAPEARNVHEYHELRDFTDDNRLLLVSERRPCQMRFLKLTPKA